MKKFIISIDQGTTSSRAILFDLKGKPVFILKLNLPNIFQEMAGLNIIRRNMENYVKGFEGSYKKKQTT